MKLVSITGFFLLFGFLQGCFILGLEPDYEKQNIKLGAEFQPDPTFGTYKINIRKVLPSPAEIAAAVPVVHIEGVARPVGAILYGHPEKETSFIGSGTAIEYADRHYILSAGHLNNNDIIYKFVYAFFDDKNEWAQEIELIAQDDVLDFSLWQFKDKNFRSPKGAAAIGRSADLKKGDAVYAYGSPLNAAHAFTKGIISKLDMGLAYRFSQPRLILHDVKIDHGNSGGPLLDEYGHLVGVNVMGRGKRNVLGLAVPIDDIAAVLRKLKKPGRIRHPDDGLALIDAASFHDRDFKNRDVPKPERPGVMVAQVGSPAYEAGFQKGDIIRSYCRRDEKYVEPKDYNEVKSYLKFWCESGDEVEFKVWRHSTKQELTLKLKLAP
jgi:S1-C subfamily serine protease